jgi:hypothetical protein
MDDNIYDYESNDLEYEIKSYLKSHSVCDLLKVVTRVLEWSESVCIK